ncbi:MAG: hypothetical protein QS98_C0006G0036 [archaeon GW2011_AR3]|nr:MAG: hypothetical protein QS98_C0006G0036 [archaeon GW2011_AR3]
MVIKQIGQVDRGMSLTGMSTPALKQFTPEPMLAEAKLRFSTEQKPTINLNTTCN